MDLDPILLSRIQFGFTIAFHILFPALTIGLASYLAMLEALWLLTSRQVFQDLYKFWVKIFAISFGMGVVSGVVMSYQLGTNWSRFSELTGNVMGPLLSYEVLTAFFLEASFLGIMLFGQQRVGRGLHFFSTCMVAVGTLISAFWILSANSWMHTPAGAEMRDGVFYPLDWWAIVFNPSFPYRLVHMVLAAYLTTAFLVGGVAAWYLWHGRQLAHARVMFSMAIGFAVIVTPLQIIAGDLHGLNVRDHQPAKLAAMEGVWETERGAPLLLFALPDQDGERNRYALGIPKLASLIVTHDLDGEIIGLKEFAAEDRPPVAIVFWSFRLMLAIGFAMLAVALAGLWLWWNGRLYDTRWFQRACMALAPSGFIAVLAGWITTEVGRQPYVVYGLLRTAEAASPVSGGAVATSLALFIVSYTVIFGAGSYFMLRLIGRGPEPDEPMLRADTGPAAFQAAGRSR
ncbi:MAG: cytochrome ubiquinol oxidase subunit I [Kiloniellales bacterium]